MKTKTLHGWSFLLRLEVLPKEPLNLFGQVAVEITLQRALEERREAGAFGNRVLGRGDQAATVDQV